MGKLFLPKHTRVTVVVTGYVDGDDIAHIPEIQRYAVNKMIAEHIAVNVESIEWDSKGIENVQIRNPISHNTEYMVLHRCDFNMELYINV